VSATLKIVKIERDEDERESTLFCVSSFDRRGIRVRFVMILLLMWAEIAAASAQIRAAL